jgi:hypothetical protein
LSGRIKSGTEVSVLVDGIVEQKTGNEIIAFLEGLKE